MTSAASAGGNPQIELVPEPVTMGRRKLTDVEIDQRYSWLNGLLSLQSISPSRVAHVLVGTMAHQGPLHSIGRVSPANQPPTYKMVVEGVFTVYIVSVPLGDQPCWCGGQQYHDELVEVNIFDRNAWP